MTVFYNFLIVLQVFAALMIIGLVLIQHGKGADMGATFGSGASGSLFGASGSASFLSRTTSVAAIIFFSATLLITMLGNKHKTAVSGGVMENLPATSTSVNPSAPPVSANVAPTKNSVPIQPSSKKSSVDQIPK